MAYRQRAETSLNEMGGESLGSFFPAVNRAFFLIDEEKTRFVERLWRVAKFSGIEVLAHCFMSNHFFAARYLTPLAKSGYIAVAGDEKNRYLPGK